MELRAIQVGDAYWEVTAINICQDNLWSSSELIKMGFLE